MKRSIGFLVLALLGMAGCDADKAGINDKAMIEGKATSEAAVQAENANRAVRAAAMEEDLERRRRFIDSIVGTYEGVTTDMQGKEAPVRMIVTSSFPRQPTRNNRERSLEELTYELTNLHLNVQVVEWSTLDSGAEIAFGCVFEQIRPNIVDGAIALMSQDCKMSYSLIAADQGPQMQIPVSSVLDVNVSRALASDVVEGKIREIPAFVGRKQSNLASKRMPVRLKKLDSQRN
jgi:hypothetical protein